MKYFFIHPALRVILETFSQIRFNVLHNTHTLLGCRRIFVDGRAARSKHVNYGSVVMVLVLSLALRGQTTQAQVSYSASGRLSQASAGQNYESSGANAAGGSVGESIPSQSYAASSGESSISCSTQALGCGIWYPSSSASISGIIRINKPSALAPLLIGPNAPLQFGIPVSVSFKVSSLNTPGIFYQASAGVSFNAAANGGSVAGSVNDINGPYGHTQNSDGIFLGSGTSGSVNASIPVLVLPTGDQSIDIGFSVSLDAENLDLAGVTPATANIQANFSAALTDASGQPLDLTALGIKVFTTPPADKPPLVFIPGIAGSVLNANRTIVPQLWPTIYPADIQALNIRTGLPGIQAVDVVREGDGFIALLNAAFSPTPIEVYKPFLCHLKSENYVEFPINDDPSRMTTNFPFAFDENSTPTLFPFPYDWRLSNADQLATLHQYIQNIRNLHGGAKVKIVAHSMGGLIARRYILEYPGDVDLVATVGTPFWGAPVAIYRMLAGGFFGPQVGAGKVDWLNNDAVIHALPTFKSFHELLPSNYYLSNAPDFYKNGDGSVVMEGNGVPFSSDVYATLIDEAASPDTPVANNNSFHSELDNVPNNGQDDWSQDDGSVSYLHICGLQGTKRTTVAVNVVSEAHGGWLDVPVSELDKYVEVEGLGDGVVPFLSSRRLDKFLAPGTQTRVIQSGPSGVYLNQDESADHVGMMQNNEVWSMIDSFLSGQTVDEAKAAETKSVAANTTPTSSWRVSITGSGYVGMVDGNGNTNAEISDLAVAEIPGVDVAYGGTQPYVDMNVNGAVDLKINGASTDPAIEVAVSQIGGDGSALSLTRYQFKTGGHAWQVHLPAANTSTAANLLASVDANGDGIFDTNEQVTPAFNSGNGPVDTTSPTLAMSQTTVAGTVMVTLTAQDDVTTNPSIHYTINDGAVQGYQAPLSFAPGTSSVLKAYAQDAMGNTSALLTTTIAPVLPVVTLAASTPTVTVGSGVPGVFTLNLSTALDYDVIVNFSIKGSAVNGSDYVLLKGSKKIKAGKTSKPIEIIPIGDLGGASKKTVVLILDPADNYAIGTGGKAKVKILPTPSLGTLEPLTLLDDAENGAGDVTIAPADPAVVTAQAGEDGNACYNLISNPSESLTLNPIIVPATGSTLQWKSELGYSTTSETAKVQISTDSGATWQDLYSLIGTNGLTEAAFSVHTVDLSPYAGQRCRVRFSYLFNSGEYYQRGGGAGWFLDDITVTGAQTPFEGF